MNLSPIDKEVKEYIHKSVYEYYIQAAIMREIKNSEGRTLDYKNSVLGKQWIN